tara:strand:- start:275 stop:460 length:186 start_codon:yes stop_codon:yes gene_type:complete
MAFTINYWHDGQAMEFAYAIYTDLELTIPAPDGWYSWEVSSTLRRYRQQLNGKLEPYADCI